MRGARCSTHNLLLLGAGLALLSSVIPYSLEIAALVGWLVLRETLGFRALVALALVTTAAIGATRQGTRAH